MTENRNKNANSLGRKFGQSEPLTVRLHGLIRSYPKGVGIFQEFIQNADDAGASWVKIVLDRRTFSGAHLPSQSMLELMGPAILIYNDQSFSDDDLISIQKIGMGSKSQSSSKTGRFGLGFNACYNVTDYPSFLTREGIYFFDPHCKAVVGATNDAPGQVWDLTLDVWENYPDLFRPFEIFGLQKEQPSFSGTAFRLPLRTIKQAASSKITHEPFLETDFDQLLQQFIPLGADMLIFLKHVTRISIYEVPSDGNDLVELLDITTVNETDVRKNRDLVNQYVNDDPEQMVRTLRNNSVIPPVVSFCHQIKLRTSALEENQTWRVVSGLFVDDQQKIVDLVEQMHLFEEKAIPWAGAATRLSLERSGSKSDINDKFQGKVFCFLPLHIETRLPVHINGFFDLDSSRQTLTTDRHILSGKDAVRAEWNTELVNLCVGRAYATLITDLVDDIGRSDIKTFYKYWPDPRKDLPGAMEGLSQAVYRHLQTVPVIRSADPENEWRSIQSLVVIEDEWQSQLQSPFAADGMPIPRPALPTHITQGYQAAGVEFNFVTPALIRNRLRVDKDINKPLSEINRNILSRRTWIVDLLKFCLSDNPGKDLVGVPLVILADQKLHTLGMFIGNVAFLASEEEQNLFSDFKYWFVETQFAEECELTPIPEAYLHKSTPQQIINSLHYVLNFPKRNPFSNWDPQAENSPNSNWLKLVYEYLSLHITEALQNEDELKKLHLVPDQFNRLWKFSEFTTPLIPPEDLSQDFQSALTKFGFPIVTGASHLVSVIREFQKKASDKFIWGFTGRDFVDTLSAFSHDWQEKFPAYIPEIHNPVLDFLSSPLVIENLQQQQNIDRIAKLKGLLVYPTIDEVLVRASDPELYLPANYDPPNGVGTLRLLSTGPDGRWKPLLRLMKIEELDRPTLIQKVLVPEYVTLSLEAQVLILEWIRDNLNLAETEQQSKNLVGHTKITDLIANSPLILCTDGNYHPCSAVYDPRQEQLIRGVLGDAANFPNLRVYLDQERWLKFFREDLGMASSPRASAILQAVDKLIVESEEGGIPLVSDRLLSIFNYIVLTENWNQLIQEKIGEGMSGINPLLLTDLLRERKWLPAQRDTKQLSRYATYQVPANRLYQPKELYMAAQGHLVVSQMPLAMVRQPDKEVTQALGFPDYPPLILVIKHFDAILKEWSEEDHNGIKEEILTRSIGAIYQYFGNLTDASDLIVLKTHYAKIECLWDPRKKIFCMPNYVFRESVQYMEPWRTQIFINNPQQDEGYTNLGRLNEPRIEDFVDFLNNLQNKFEGLFLTDEISRQVLEVLRRLSTALMDNDAKPIFPVLTQSNRLIDYTDVYVFDARWLQDKLFENSIHFLLHAEVPSELIKVVGIRLLSKSIQERMPFDPSPSNSPELQIQCNQLQNLICSKEFHSGIMRLIRAEYGDHTENLNWLKQTSICAVESINVDIWLVEEHFTDHQIGSGVDNYFIDRDKLTIYLTPQKPTVMHNVLGQAINSQLGDLKLSDTAFLTAILGFSPDEIDETLDQLHVAALPEQVKREFVSPEIDGTIGYIGNDNEDELPTLESFDERQEESEDRTDTGKNNTQQPSTEIQSQAPAIEPGSEEFNAPDIQQSGQKEKDEYLGHEQGEQDWKHQPGRGNIDHRNEDPEFREPTGEDVPPPTQPGDGKSPASDQPDSGGLGSNYPPRESWAGKKSGKHSGSHSTNDRIFTSGVYSHQGQQSELGETDSQNDEIGNRAVDRVINHEIKQGNKPIRMPHNNPGYDIEVYDADGQTLLKYIEVKGINGSWGVGGVSISSTQYDFGELHPDKFWLYVVEYALDNNASQIYPIQNPTRHITHYRFDHGWKDLANIEAQFVPEPAVGLYVLNKEDQTVGLIVKVRGSGVLKQITIRFEDGREEGVLYKPNLMDLIAAPGE
ncbi:MAG: DUF3883 domain-containing protein [Chloroflexi bacterium]|nr:DUF3883 domain-containing protein [Chloroflexota bacterium]